MKWDARTDEGICYDVMSHDSLLKSKWDPAEHLMGLRSRISVLTTIPRDCGKYFSAQYASLLHGVINRINTISMIRDEMGNFINFGPSFHWEKKGWQITGEEASEQGLKAGTP